jgi:hypothetical protein
MDITFTPDDPELGEVEFKIDEEALKSNVIMFPKNPRHTPPQTQEELYTRIREEQQNVAIDISTEVVCSTLSALSSMGFNITKDPKTGYDVAMVLECVKALVMRMQGAEHPLHNNIEEIVPLEEFGTSAEAYYSQFLDMLDE